MPRSNLRRLALVASGALLASGALTAVVSSPASAATVTLSPAFGSNTDPARVVAINGGPWANPSLEQVTFTRHGGTETLPVTLSGSSTTTKLVVSLDLRLAAPGKYDVSVTPGTAVAPDTCSSCFTVAAAGTPTLTGISPNTRGQGTSASAVTLTGTNFAKGATVRVVKSDGTTDANFTFTNLSVTNSTSATAQLAVAATASPGAHTVQWTNTDGQFGNCPGCLIVNAGPHITSKSQSTIGQNADRDVTFTGSGFVSGATVSFQSIPGVDDSSIQTSDVRVSGGTSLTVHVHVNVNAVTGSRTVVITNPDGGSTSTTMSVTTKPTVSSVTERDDDGVSWDDSSQAQGSSRVFDFNGPGATQNGFVSGTTFTVGGGGVTVSAYSFQNNGDIQATLTVASNAAPGPRDVFSFNPDGGRNTCSGCISVIAAPTISNVDPNAVAPGDSGTFTIHGTNLGTGASVVMQNGRGVSLTSTPTCAPTAACNTGTGTSLSVNYSVSPSATQGTVAVTVNNGGSGSATCSGCVFINGLSVSGLVPDAVSNGAGASNQSFTIGGSGFNNPTVTLTPDPQIPGQNPIVAVVDSSTATSITFHANLTIAAPGTYDVDVANQGNSNKGRCGTCLTIANLGNPALTSITPSHLAQGQQRTVTLAGSGFSRGMTLLIGGSGITVGPVTVSSPTSATVTLTAASDAPTTSRTGRLQLADGTQGGTTSNALTVSPAPTLELTWPSDLLVGDADLTPVPGTVDNGASAASFDKGRVDFTISDPGLEAADLTIEDHSGDPDCTTSVGTPISLTDQPDGSITGSIPPAAGSALAAGATQDVLLCVKVGGSAPTGSMTVNSAYGDVSGTDRVDTVASDTDTVGLHALPSVPQDVTAKPGNHSALVSWTAPASDGGTPITHYVITTHPGGAETVVDPTDVPKLITGLTNGQSYTFSVRARNAVGDSTDSAATSAVVPHAPTTALSLPTSLVAGGSPTASSVTVTNDTVTEFAKARLDFVIAGLAGLTPSRVSVIDTENGGSVPVTLHQSGSTLRGSVPDSGTFDLTSDSTKTVPMTIALDRAAPAGSLSVTAKLVDASGSPDVTVSSDQDSAIVVASTGRLVTFRTPAEIVNSHSGLRLSQGRHSGVNTFTIPTGTGAGKVPASAQSVVLDVHVDSPSRNGFVRVYPAGGAIANRALTYQASHPQDQVTVTRMNNHQVTLRLSAGTAYIKVDLLGYETPSDTSGGQFVAVAPKRVGDTRGATPGKHRIATVTLPSTVPSTASAVLVDVTALDTTSAGTMKVYPGGATAPKAVAVDFVKSTPHTSAYITRIGTGRTIVVRIDGYADALVDLVGYYTSSQTWAGRYRSLIPTALSGVKSSGKTTLTLPSGVPANATSAVFSVTAAGASSIGSLRTYAAGTTEPAPVTLGWGKGHSASGLVVSRVGTGGKVTFDVRGGSPTISVELIGFTTR